LSRPKGNRAAQVVLRTLHICAMALVLGGLAMMGSSISAACANVYAKHQGTSLDPMVTVAIQLSCGGIALTLFSLVMEPHARWHWTMESLIALLFLSIFGSLLAGAIPQGGFGSTPSLKSLSYKSPNEKLNIASIGAGGKASNDIDGCSQENIVALCDVDDRQAAAKYKEYDKVPKYKDFRKMLDQEKGIDAVIVTIPDFMHATAAVWAMERGKHVYVQKPLVRTVWEARLMLETANKYGVATQMGNQGYSNEGTRQVAEMIWSGEIGNVTEVHAWTDRPGKYWPQSPDVVPQEAPVPATIARRQLFLRRPSRAIATPNPAPRAIAPRQSSSVRTLPSTRRATTINAPLCFSIVTWPAITVEARLCFRSTSRAMMPRVAPWTIETSPPTARPIPPSSTETRSPRAIPIAPMRTAMSSACAWPIPPYSMLMSSAEAAPMPPCRTVTVSASTSATPP